MIAVARQIGDLHLGIGDCCPDHRLDLVGGHRHGDYFDFDQLAAGVDHRLVQRATDLCLVDLDSGGGQVAEQLADHVLVARFLEIGLDDRLGIGIGFLGRQAHLLRRPLPQQPVAARGDAELHFLVTGELGLEGAFAVVEAGHAETGP